MIFFLWGCAIKVYVSLAGKNIFAHNFWLLGILCWVIWQIFDICFCSIGWQSPAIFHKIDSRQFFFFIVRPNNKVWKIFFTYVVHTEVNAHSQMSRNVKQEIKFTRNCTLEEQNCCTHTTVEIQKDRYCCKGLDGWWFLKQSCQHLQIGFSVSWLSENTTENLRKKTT